MVSNNTKRNIALFVFMVFNACNFHYVLHNVLYCVNLENVVNVLNDASKSFKAHTCIDIRICKRCIVVFTVIFKLSENKIPEFNVTVTFATNLTIRAATTVFFTAVIVKLRTRTARTLAVLPEVILFTESYHMVGLYSNLFCPYIVSLVVIKINATVNFVGVHFHNLSAEFPSPRNNLFFEVVAKREVAEHFKICSVTGCDTNSFNIGSTNTFLTGCNSLSWGSFFACEIFFHRCHTCIDKKNTLITLRYK